MGSNLTSIALPASIDYSSYQNGGWFRECKSLVSADVSYADVITKGMFEDCSALVNVKLSNTYTKIGD